MRANKQLLSVFRYLDMSGGPDACWPCTLKANSEGRNYISINGQKYLVYRLTWELLNGEELGKRLLRHTCDHEWCCNPQHGIPGDHQQNMDDMKERERHGMPHHTVRMIRKLLALGIPHADIATKFGCSRVVITEINTGKYYSHVKDDDDGDGDDDLVPRA